MRYLLLLFLAGCAGNQSAFPVAPPFNPMTDAPITIGHPGTIHPGPRIEPNPKPTRVLPQTPETRREDGLWAGGPVARGHDDDGDGDGDGPLLFGIHLPSMDGAETSEDYAPAQRCASTMFDAAMSVGATPVLGNAPEKIRRCAAATLYYACMKQTVQRDKAKANPEPHELGAIRRNAETLRVAGRFATHACDGLAIPQDAKTAMATTLQHWVQTWTR